MLFGLKLLNISIAVIWLELDFLLLVQILQGEIICPRKFFYYVQAIKFLLQRYTCFIPYVFREGNVVADWLANEAVNHQENKVFYSIQELPKHIKGALVLDMDFLPPIRL